MFRGAVWSFLGKFCVMGMKFGVNLVLARLLTPTDFGAIGMLWIFLAISLTFIDGGFGSALIQKKNPTESDYSTIIIWNFGVSIIFYSIIYFVAPLISTFYSMPILKNVFRVCGLSLIILSLTSIQVNKLQKQLDFKTIAISDIISYILCSLISILMAYLNYGIWSLVMLAILQPFFRSIYIIIKTKWLPIFSFSIVALKQLLSFSGFLLISNLLENIGKNLQGLIIGKYYNAAQLGYYNQAERLNNIVSYSIPQTLALVMYPIFSQFQDDKKRLNEIIIMNLKAISILIYPILCILILYAGQIISLLYGNKWDSSIPYFQILCCGGFFYCLNDITYYGIAACGKSKALLYSGIYKWGFLILLLMCAIPLGMKWLVSAIAVSYINIFLINSILIRKYTGLQMKKIYISILPAFLTSGSMLIFYILIFQYFLHLYWMFVAVLYLITCYFICYKCFPDTFKLIIYNLHRNE